MAARFFYFWNAKIAQKAQRFEEMAGALNEIIAMGTTLTIQERNLLLHAYKEIITNSRRAWHSLEFPDDVAATGLLREQRLEMAYGYRQQIEIEIRMNCNQIIYLVDTRRFPAENNEQTIFNYKTSADYYHFLSELTVNNEPTVASHSCFICYQTAISLAMQQLPPAHPLRLRLSLNFAVFYNNVLKMPAYAIQLAGDELSRACHQMRMCPQRYYGYSACIMYDMRNHLSIWAATIRRSKEVRVLYFKSDFKIDDDADEHTNDTAGTSKKINLASNVASHVARIMNENGAIVNDNAFTDHTDRNLRKCGCLFCSHHEQK